MFEYLMKIHEVIALKHIETMLTLMKMLRFDVSRVDQALYAYSLSKSFIRKT